MMLGKTLSYHFKRGKLSFLGKPLFNALIQIELLYVRWKDRSVAFPHTPLMDEKLTAIIKTFERSDVLKRLVKSIKRFYPNLRIIVVDDSEEPLKLKGVDTIVMPYDSGVSAGRQKALDAVKTPYVLLLDDDFICYGKSDFEVAMESMEKHTPIDIMGGEVVNLPSFKSADYSQARLHASNATSVQEVGTKIDGMPVYDKVPNFYIARTERLKLVGWDKRIKRLDHAEFFTRAKGVLLTVYNPKMKILHAQTPYNKKYLKKRNDIEADRRILFEKYYKT